jgi:hypothetical protein
MGQIALCPRISPVSLGLSVRAFTGAFAAALHGACSRPRRRARAPSAAGGTPGDCRQPPGCEGQPRLPSVMNLAAHACHLIARLPARSAAFSYAVPNGMICVAAARGRDRDSGSCRGIEARRAPVAGRQRVRGRQADRRGGRHRGPMGLDLLVAGAPGWARPGHPVAVCSQCGHIWHI